MKIFKSEFLITVVSLMLPRINNRQDKNHVGEIINIFYYCIVIIGFFNHTVVIDIDKKHDRNMLLCRHHPSVNTKIQNVVTNVIRNKTIPNKSCSSPEVNDTPKITLIKTSKSKAGDNKILRFILISL